MELDEMHTAYVGLGANWGRRLETLRQAVSLMSQFCNVCESSGVYQTAAWGYIDPHPYFNAVVMIRTQLSPEDLLFEVQRVERFLGRNRNGESAQNQGYEGRVIDLDILFYDDLIVERDGLCLPHPLLTKRRFVLQPLNDIAPNFNHPILLKSVGALLESCSDKEAALMRYEKLG